MILLRWLIRLVTVALVLGLIGIGSALWFASRSLPDYNEDFTLSGLNAPVEIVRDSANIPHILAQNDADAFYALGFSHAQDRLWQMTLLRRTAQGRLSEVFGKRTLKTDELLRRLDLYGLAQRSFSAQDRETQDALEAYANGVNAWLAEVSKGARGRGAPEFFVFPSEIPAWSPADSIAIIKLMALRLSAQAMADVRRARLSLLLADEARVRDLLSNSLDAPDTFTPPSYSSLVPNVAPSTAPLRSDEGALSPIPPAPELAGSSNIWAAASARTAAGAPLMANDSHTSFSAPGMWYLTQLDLQSGPIIGATIPGVPAIFLGRSEHLGWGLTSSYLDDQDVVLERVNPQNPDEYETAHGWQPFKTRRSIIVVKDSVPVTITLRWSESGPIIPGNYYGFGEITPPGYVAALSWTALSPTDTSMTAALRLMQAQSVDAGIAAGALFVAPAQNLVLAAEDGIAYQLIGAMPQRDAAHPSQGLLPAKASTPGVRWLGTLPYEQNPRTRNPVTGMVGNTNNKTSDAPFPRHVSHNWGDTQRILRWQRLMDARRIHSRESFIEAQLDTTSGAMRTLLSLIGADLWFTGAAAPENTPASLRQRALALIAAWNGEMDRNMPEPLIASAWLHTLQKRLIQDELGALSDDFMHVNPIFIERVFRGVDGADIWCDVVTSRISETCSEQALAALDDALLTLSERYGGLPESWRWGEAHEARHDHSTLGDVPGLGWVFNINLASSGGDFTLQRGKTISKGDNPYLNVHGPGYRGVYDFSDPDSSLFVIATGQSGHPLSSYYDDMSRRWGAGDYVPMSLDPELARAAAAGISQLRPQDP